MSYDIYHKNDGIVFIPSPKKCIGCGVILPPRLKNRRCSYCREKRSKEQKDNAHRKRYTHGNSVYVEMRELNKMKGEMKKGLPENWRDSLNPESVKNAVAAGNILPSLDLKNLGMNDNYRILVIEEPHLVRNEALPNGEAYFMTVEHDGAHKSLVCPMSLLFNLEKECVVNKLGSPKGKNFLIGKKTADTKYGKDSLLYWVQFAK